MQIDTMKGTKIGQLSPLTRKLNQTTGTTIVDLDEYAMR